VLHADAPLAARGDAVLDPAGVWACVAYANEASYDERFLLHLTGNGGGSIARQGATSAGQWAPTSPWAVERSRLAFRDYRSTREYTADLTRSTLGGTWQSVAAHGGWWCTRRLQAEQAQLRTLRRSAAEFFVPPLVPDVSASPTYPRQAIRNAKEGRAVACFLVDPSGAILEPELLELSDEVFRDTTLLALFRSRYRPWQGGEAARAGCRTYLFELDAIF